MIKTIQKTRKQISNLSVDIEIVNPIESKSLFGGSMYCDNGMSRWTGTACTAYYCDHGGNSSSGFGGSMMNNNGWGSFGSQYIPDNNDVYSTGGGSSGWVFGDYVSPDSIIWQDANGDGIYDPYQVVDNNGDGINDADMQWVHEAYPGELSAPEAVWLYMHPTYVSAMYSNQQLAFSLAPGLNGVGDAFRHALWSALDAFDIGSENAYEFHTLHEVTHWHDEQSPSDLHNNGWGYNWAILNGNPEANMTQFLADFDAAVANGHLSILP